MGDAMEQYGRFSFAVSSAALSTLSEALALLMAASSARRASFCELEGGLVSGVLILRDQAILRQRGVTIGLLFGVGGLDAVARQIGLGLGDERVVFFDGGLRLIDGLLIRARIDFKKLLAFADVVAFFEEELA